MLKIKFLTSPEGSRAPKNYYFIKKNKIVPKRSPVSELPPRAK